MKKRIWVFSTGSTFVIVDAETGKKANELLLKKYKTHLLFKGCFEIEENDVIEI